MVNGLTKDEINVITDFLEQNKSGVGSVAKNQNVYVFNPEDLINLIKQ